MAHHVVFSARAEQQLQSLYRYIAEESGEARAESYVGRLVGQCVRLSDFPEMGRPRFDIRPGMRTLGYKRQATITYSIDGETVAILGVFYGGQDFERRMIENDESD